MLRSSVGRDVLVVDAKNGDTVWQASGQATDNAGAIRGGVVIYKDKIIVPISASGVVAGAARDVRMLHRPRRGRRAVGEGRHEAVGIPHDATATIHRRSLVDRREAARAVGRADLGDSAR